MALTPVHDDIYMAENHIRSKWDTEQGAFLFLQQQAEKSSMSIQWNQSPDLWCIIVCAHSWNYEEEMLMSCCWRHHESNASMCVAYWMIMTKCTISPVSKPAEQWLQIGQCVLRITREPGSNANHAAARWNISVLAGHEEISWNIQLRL